LLQNNLNVIVLTDYFYFLFEKLYSLLRLSLSPLILLSKKKVTRKINDASGVKTPVPDDTSIKDEIAQSDVIFK